MKHRIIPTHRIEDGLDRQNLSILRKRFLAINEDRLKRMRGALNTRHQLFLDALPMLLHCNHPMLPGFNGRQTPCKISGFKPSDNDIKSARAIARSFTLNYDPNTAEEIYGIYVMGSVGTIAQSERSDLDIWLCHQPNMDADRTQKLQDKCERITYWADQQRLEVHFFLMDYKAFQRGQQSSLDKESSGSAQRLLLLDEFYRSAIFISGRMPLWWFVPESAEKNYDKHAEQLLNKRFIMPHHVLDFGGVTDIPGGEFIGAGIWQLYKAIESPYKSVLKLLLLEIYVSEYPNIRPLALHYKSLIFDGELDIDKLDSYVMIYERIEKYLLQKGQQKRLELARRCFYFKVNRHLSKHSSRATRLWQRELLGALIDRWQWTHEELTLLDSRRQWKVNTVTSERSLLVNELNHCYKVLHNFVQNTGNDRTISAEELALLGRKLQAAFERGPGKIEWINPNISKDLSEDLVEISCTFGPEKNKTWAAHTVNGPVARRETQVIHSSNSFAELLLWCYYNHIIEAHTHIELGSIQPLSAREARRVIAIFEQWLPNPGDLAEHEQFLHAAQPKRTLLLLNVEGSPSPELSQSGLQRLSEHSDALSYGGQAENLVVSSNLITVNSWNEIHIRHFDKSDALLDALKEYLQLCLPGTHQQPPELQVECIASEHANIIAHRVQELFDEIVHCFYRPGAGKRRYLFHLSEKYHSLKFQGMRPDITAYANEAQLLDALAKPQREYCGLALDNRCLRNMPLALIANKMRRNTINIFYRRTDFNMEIYIADEKGSISRNITRTKRGHNPMIPLHRFLRSTINREAKSQPDLLADFGICPIYFYELQLKKNQTFVAQQRPVSQNTQQTHMFEVKAVAYAEDDLNVAYDFYCDQQEFSHASFKDQLYLVVAQFILSRRRRGENYPIYMTDLDLSRVTQRIHPGGKLQISHYLHIRNMLENKLNEAINVLINS